MNKKFITIVAVIIVVFALSAFFGARFAASYYYQKGLSQYRQNNYREAKKNLNFALIFNYKNPFPHFILGRIALGLPDLAGDNYYPNADYKEAVLHQEKAVQYGLLKKSPKAYGQALDDLGISYWYLGDYDNSVKYYLEAIRLYPERSFWPRLLVAEHYFERANKPEEALKILKPALDLEQANSDYNQRRLYHFYSLVSRLYGYSFDFSNADKYAKLAVKSAEARTDTDVQIAHAIIALAAGQKKDFSKAESEIEKSNALANSSDAHNCVLASAYYLGENYKKAISIAKAMKRSDNYRYSVCLAALGNSYLALKNQAEVKKYYEEYLSLTNTLKDKNIFVFRNRERFTEELLKLK